MKSTTPRNLIKAGAILFLLGLLTGFAISLFENPRMGLSSHLEGVMNGTFLIALGAAWSYVRLSPLQTKVSYWLLIYGAYANWVFITIAAVFGTSKTTPIAGNGYSGDPWQEHLITAGLITVGITMVLGCAMVVYGLFPHEGSGEPNH